MAAVIHFNKANFMSDIEVLASAKGVSDKDRSFTYVYPLCLSGNKLSAGYVSSTDRGATKSKSASFWSSVSSATTTVGSLFTRAIYDQRQIMNYLNELADSLEETIPLELTAHDNDLLLAAEATLNAMGDNKSSVEEGVRSDAGVIVPKATTTEGFDASEYSKIAVRIEEIPKK